MPIINTPDKVTGDLHSAAEYNAFKSAINDNYDGLAQATTDIADVAADVAAIPNPFGVAVAPSDSIPLDKPLSLMSRDAATSGPVTLTPNTLTARRNGACLILYRADGNPANKPNYAAFVLRGADNWDNTLNMMNELIAYRSGNFSTICITPLGIEVGDTTPPQIVSIEAVDATHIEVTLDESVNPTNYAGWSFKKNGSNLAISAIGGMGTAVLSFTVGTMLNTDTLLASYDSTLGDTEDADANELIPFTDAAVTNSIPTADTTAPTLVSATVDNLTPTQVDLVFDEPMTGTWSAAAAWGVTGHTVTAVTRLTATTGYLTVSVAFTNGEAARTLSYTQPVSDKMQDLAGNLLATFSGEAITNNVSPADVTAPTLVSATVEDATPTRVDLVFSEAMNATWSAAAAFAVTGHTVSAVTRVTATTGYLTVTVPFTNGEAARTLAYTQPGSNKMQDLAGNLLANIASASITNNAAAVTLVDAVFSTQSVGITESPAHQFNMPDNSYMLADGSAAANCAIEAEVPSGIDELIIFGLDTGSSHDNYITPGWSLYSFIYLGNYYVGGTGLSATDTGIAAAAGDLYGIYRVGSAFKFRVDSGAGYVDRYTFTFTSSATIYHKAAADNVAGTKILLNPKVQGFA